MFKQIDWILLLLVIAIVLYGFIAITSTTSSAYYEDEQNLWDYLINTANYATSSLHLVFFLVGLAAMAVLLLVDYNNLRDFSNIIYWLSVVMLLAVLLFSKSTRGIFGWFKIGSRGFQPAEFCKVFMIIVLSKEFAKVTEGHNGGITQLRQLWPMIWRFIIPFVLIILQPDWGTALVYLFVFAGLMLMAKVSWKIIGICGLSVAAIIPLAWLLLEPWQKDRIYVFLDPMSDPEGAGFNVIRAMTVGSHGGVTGKGFFSPELLTQTANYLPEEHTDFLFSANLEAVGYVGGIILVALYFMLLLRMVYLSTRAKDDFGTYLVLGVSFMFLFHIFENIGMNIGIMPVTGIPLPFFSYGGSNMLTCMLCIGLVQNVNMRRMRYSTLQ